MRTSAVLPVALVLGLLSAAPVGAAPASRGPFLQHLWTVTGLADPESVALSQDGRFFYVSNVNGEADAKDGNGFISKISRDGHIIDLHWAAGMDGPKGLTLSKGRLYAADITRLAEIDAGTGKILAFYDAPGAKFLNDTAVDRQGRVLVSDSATHRIYRLEGGKLTVWADDPQLRGANGLLVEPERLVVVTMGGLLLAMDHRTRAITVLARGLGDGDGLAALGGGRYLVSEWPGLLYVVEPDGSRRTLIDSRKQGAYINDLLLVGDTLYLPHMKPGSLEALRVRPAP